MTAGTWTLAESAPGSGLWTLTGSGFAYTNTYRLGDPDTGPGLGTYTIAGTMVATAVYGAQSIQVLLDTETTGSVLGGSTTTGGVDVECTDVTTTGTLAAQAIDTDGLPFDAVAALASETNFSLAGTPQIWDVSFGGGAFTGPITLTFAYDDALLGGVPETALFVWHYDAGADDWEKLFGPIDTVANTITVTISSLSPFAIGVPEPATWLLSMMAAAGLLGYCRRRNRG